jgi:hypothetical protein
MDLSDIRKRTTRANETGVPPSTPGGGSEKLIVLSCTQGETNSGCVFCPLWFSVRQVLNTHQ